MKFLHLADSHVHARSSNDPLIERMEYVNTHYADYYKPITGDMTDDGSEDQYGNAKEICRKSLIIPVPGNHDYGAIGSLYSKASAKMFDHFASTFRPSSYFGKNPQVILLGNMVFICLNSCKKTTSPFDFARGQIGWRQRWKLGKLLDQHKDLIRIVALHHHPFVHSDPGMELEDAEQFLKVIYGKVDVLLFGHKHEQRQWQDKAGCKWVLAAGAVFKEQTAKAIIIEGSNIQIEEVRIL